MTAERTESDDYVITGIVYNENFVLQGLDGPARCRICDADYVD